MVLEPGAGTWHGDIVQKVEARETGGRWGAVVVRSDRGSSGWTHLHRGEPEGFFVLEGELELCGAESVTRIDPGFFVLVPPDTEHSFRVLGDEARWLAIWPSSLDGLLEDLEKARESGRDDPETIAIIRAQHGTESGRRIGKTPE